MPVDSTIIAIANEHSSRILVRRQNSAAVEDLVEFCESADFLEHSDIQPSELSRKAGRVALKARAKKQEELMDLFLRRVAAQVDLAVGRHNARRLVLLAPPPVLSRWRDLFTASTRTKLVCELAEDRIEAPLAAVEELLHSVGA